MIRKTEHNNRAVIDIDFHSHHYSIDSSASQMLSLLFSSYDSLLHKNAELEQKENELLELNDILRRKAEERKRDLNTQLGQIIQDEKMRKGSEEMYKELVENTLAGIYICSLDGQILQCNDAFIRLLEYDDPTDIMMARTSDLFEDSGLHTILLNKLRYQTIIREFEVNLLSKKGKIIHGIVNARLDGETISGMVVDATEMIEAEIRMKEYREQLIISKNKAECSEKLKTSFLANMSNEILTPLKALKGFSELIAEEGLQNKKQKEYFEKINHNGNHLVNIVENIIDIARIESGDVSIRRFEYNINKLMLDLYVNFEQVLAESNMPGIELKLRRDLKYDDFSILTEHFRLKSIMNNLLNNAVRNTNSGVIEFGYTLLSDRAEGKSGQVQFYVKDTGKGISNEDLVHIFDRFRSSVGSNYEESEGARMGLPLIKAYIELLGGKIWIKSKPGQGTEVYFTLPFDSNRIITSPGKNSETDAAADHTNLKDLTILIAEDIKTNYDVLRLLLSELEPTLIWARNGREAVDLFKEESHIDLILMDLRMPVMTGHEAIAEIRKLDKEIPIIVQTAFALADDKDEILETGCNGFITKPIQRHVLVDEIRKVLSNHVYE